MEHCGQDTAASVIPQQMSLNEGFSLVGAARPLTRFELEGGKSDQRQQGRCGQKVRFSATAIRGMQGRESGT